MGTLVIIALAAIFAYFASRTSWGKKWMIED